jgi:hypothetical protein
MIDDMGRMDSSAALPRWPSHNTSYHRVQLQITSPKLLCLCVRHHMILKSGLELLNLTLAILYRNVAVPMALSKLEREQSERRAFKVPDPQRHPSRRSESVPYVVNVDRVFVSERTVDSSPVLIVLHSGLHVTYSFGTRFTPDSLYYLNSSLFRQFCFFQRRIVPVLVLLNIFQSKS